MLWGNKLIWVFKGILLAAVFRAKHAKFIVSLNDFFIKVWTLAENSVMHCKVKTVIRAITDRITDLWIPLNPSKVWWLTYCICRSAICSFIEVKVQILVMLNMVLMRQLRGWSEHKFISLCLHRVLPWMTGILFNKTFLCYFCWNGVFPEQIGSSVFQPKLLLLGTIFQRTKRFLQPVVVFSLSLKNLAFFTLKCTTFDFVSVHHSFAFSCDSIIQVSKQKCSWNGCVCGCRLKRKIVAEIKCFSTESPVLGVYALLESTLLSGDFLQGRIISMKMNLDPGPCGGNTLSSS